MPERKQFIATILICMIIARWFLPWIQYWPVLQDPEYDQAILRATQYQHPYREDIQNYPFQWVQRDEWAIWFAWYATLNNFPHRVENCLFTDIDDLSEAMQFAILQWCRYGYFRWFQWWFVPQDPLSKAAAIVVVTRMLFPTRSFPDVEEFRVPYMEQAVQVNVLRQPDHPYLMYPVSRYELLLMLYRAQTHQEKVIENS